MNKALKILKIYPIIGTAVSALLTAILLIYILTASLFVNPEPNSEADTVIQNIQAILIIIVVTWIILFGAIVAVENIRAVIYVKNSFKCFREAEAYIEASQELALSHKKIYILALVVSLFGLVGSVWTIWITALMLYVLVSVAFQSGIIGALGLHGLYREGKIGKGQFILTVFKLFIPFLDIYAIKSIRKELIKNN